MRSLCAHVAPPACLTVFLAVFLTSCASPPAPPHPITTALGFGGADGSEPYKITLGRDAISRERSSKILVGRSGVVPVELHTVDSEPKRPKDEEQAHRLAGIAQWTIARELGIPADLGLTVIVCPVPELRTTRIEADLPAESGMAFGVPSVGGEIQKEHASSFVFGLTHEYVEHFLTDSHVGGLHMVARDPQCQWIADGIAGIVATKALAAALHDKQAIVELSPIGYVALLENEIAKGRKTVALSTDINVQERLTGTDRIVRQAAAEYICFRWFAGALKRGIERPVAALVAMLRDLPYGPGYEDLAEWMQKTSGNNVAKEAESVSLEAVYNYHRANWLSLGWKKEVGS